MQISQIFLTDNDSPLPPYLAQCVAAAQSLFPRLRHVLYNLADAREYISRNFGREVLEAFDKLNPYAYKADLLKYCLLHGEGGWYFDIAVRPIASIDPPAQVETITFKDLPIISQTCWTCTNSVLYAKPGSAVYARAIDLVIQNCKKNYYGTSALCPTGPVVLGKAFAVEGESPDRVFGDFIYLTPLHRNKNPAYILPDGLIFALGKPIGPGDLTAVGAAGTNNYNHFFSSRTVYK